jgi:hypothetical protein
VNEGNIEKHFLAQGEQINIFRFVRYLITRYMDRKPTARKKYLIQNYVELLTLLSDRNFFERKKIGS